MSEAVGTVHLTISADLNTLEARLKQRFAVIGKQLGDQLGQDIGRQAARGVETSMAGVAKTAFVPLEQSAKQAGKKISDNLKVDVKTDKAKAQLDALAGQKRIVELQIEANTRKAEAKVAEFDAQENQLRIDVDAGTEGAKAKLDALLAHRKTFEIDVEVQTLRAKQQLDSIDQRRKVIYEADAKTEGAKAKFDSLGRSIGGISSGFSTLGLLGVASMGTLIPVAVAATGAVLALGVAAAGVGASFGVAALAFSGVGTALTALNNQESKAGETAAQAASAAISMANAQDSLKAAHQGVADAIRSASQSNVAAEQRTADAERNLRSAQQDELVAQQDLTRARQDAVRQLQDMAAQSEDAQLRERQATLDLQQATIDLQRVRSDPRSTQLEIQQAILRRDMAVQGAKEAHTAAQRSVADNQAAQKAGVEGSDAVVQARGRVRDANSKVHQSEQDVATARANEVESARQGAQSIARAQQGVVQAMRGVQSAMLANQQVGATTANAVKEAFADLSPAAQHFARFLYGLKGQFDDLRAAAASALLPPMEKAIGILLPYFPQVRAFVTSVGVAMGDVAIKIARSLTGPEWKAFFTAVRTEAPDAIRTMGDIFVSLGKIIARVFTAAAPYAKPLLDAIKGFFQKIDDETSGAGGKNKLKSLFDGIMPTLGSVWNVVTAIGRVLGSLATAGSGGQGSAADTLNRLANSINKLATYIDNHPEVVGQLINISVGMLAIKAAGPAIGVIGSLGQAIGGLAAVINLFREGGALAGLFATGGLFGAEGAMASSLGGLTAAFAAVTAPVWLVIGVLVALVAGVAIAYFKVKWFHDGVNTAVHAIGEFFVWLWQKAVSPALHAIGAVFQWLYNNVIHPVWNAIHLVIQVQWALIEVIFGTIEIVVKAQQLLWRWLYDHVIKPVWSAISGFISERWNKHIKPVLDLIGSYLKTTVAPRLQVAIGVIKGIWNGLLEIFKAPIRFLIQTVLDDGLFAAYNWVAKKFGVKPDNVNVPVPSWLRAGGGTTASTSGAGRGGGGTTQQRAFATGGSVFGPGTGTSDSIPALLSNGEHVWTAREVRAAGGHDAVEAIRGAVLEAGGPQFAGGGGVFNWVKDKVTSAGKWAWNSAKSLGSLAQDFLTDPLGILKKIATSALNKIPGGQDGLLSKILVGMTNKVVGGVADFAKSKLGFGGAGGGGGGPVPGGVEHWRTIALQALRMTGNPISLIGSLLRRMNQESGGNPQAINLWDSNAKAGTPSKGLMQVIDPTFRDNHMPGTSWDIYDPLANITSSLLYAARNYSSVAAAYNRSGGYDSGGWLQPGSTLVHNNTGKPEAVFSPSQWRALEANLRDGGDGGDFSKTTSIDVHTYGDPNAIATAMMAAQERADLLDAISL